MKFARSALLCSLVGRVSGFVPVSSHFIVGIFVCSVIVALFSDWKRQSVTISRWEVACGALDEMARATQNSSQRAVAPRPSAAEATPRQSGDNWFNEQLRRQQAEENAGPSPFERSRKLADGNEIPPDPRAEYDPSSYYGTNVDAADGVLSTSEHAKSAFLAAFVGIWAAFPILGLHYLVFSDYTYTTFANGSGADSCLRPEFLLRDYLSACYALGC